MICEQIIPACFATHKTAHLLPEKPATGSFFCGKTLSGFDSPDKVRYAKQKAHRSVLFVLVTRGGR